LGCYCALSVAPVINCSSGFSLFFYCSLDPRDLHSFPTRRSSDLERDMMIAGTQAEVERAVAEQRAHYDDEIRGLRRELASVVGRSEEHTSELQSRRDLVCRLLLEKKKITSAALRVDVGHEYVNPG